MVTLPYAGACDVQVAEGVIVYFLPSVSEGEDCVVHCLTFAFVDGHHGGKLEGKVGCNIGDGGSGIVCAVDRDVQFRLRLAGTEGYDKSRLCKFCLLRYPEVRVR